MFIKEIKESAKIKIEVEHCHLIYTKVKLIYDLEYKIDMIDLPNRRFYLL